jgi:DNA replication protein DnaC
MADSEIKTIGQVLQKTALFNRPTEQRTCEAHGAYLATQFPSGNWSQCETCKEEEQAAIRAEQMRLREIQDREDRIIKARIPKRFWDCSLESYIPTNEASRKAFNLAKAYAEDFEEMHRAGACLIFCGGVGTGKTHLAVGIMKRVMEKRMRVRFASVIEAVSSVKETYSSNSDLTEQKAIDEFIHPDLLVLDEVGAQFGSDTEKLILFRIINGRYESVLPTIVISNLAKESLAEFVGERVIDRLRENGGRLIAFDWGSYRRKGAKESS